MGAQSSPRRLWLPQRRDPYPDSGAPEWPRNTDLLWVPKQRCVECPARCVPQHPRCKLGCSLHPGWKRPSGATEPGNGGNVVGPAGPIASLQNKMAAEGRPLAQARRGRVAPRRMRPKSPLVPGMAGPLSPMSCRAGKGTGATLPKVSPQELNLASWPRGERTRCSQSQGRCQLSISCSLGPGERLAGGNRMGSAAASHTALLFREKMLVSG